MPVIKKMQNSFTSGELDPVLRARSDIQSYYTGAQKLRNVLVAPQGGAYRRPGLEKVLQLSGNNIRLINFVRSAVDTYIIEISLTEIERLKFTVYKDETEVWAEEQSWDYTAVQISELTWAQSYDTLLIFHQVHAPIYLRRIADDNWETGLWPLINIPTYRFSDTHQYNADLTITKDSDNNPIDFSTWIDGDTRRDTRFTLSTGIWWVDSIGKYIRGPLGGYALIESIKTSPNDNQAIGTILAKFTNDFEDAQTQYKIDEWSMEENAWGDTRGYPRCGTFFQGRLWLTASPAQPNTLWASKTNNEVDFGNWTPSFDDNGIAVSAGGKAFISFHSIFAGEHLFLLSDLGEYYIPKSNAEPITPTNISIIASSNFGSEENLRPLNVERSLIFIKKGKDALIESQYNFAQGGYVYRNLTLVSSHVLKNPVDTGYKKLDETNKADNIIIVNEDGAFSILCLLTNQEITAWTQGSTDGLVKHVIVSEGKIYFAVERYNGTYLEKFNKSLLLDFAVYLKSETLITSVSGLTYLDGQEVQIVVDNTVYPPKTVSGDSITLDTPGYEVHVGYDFPIVDVESDSRVFIESMPLEVETDAGTSVGKKKRVSEITFLLYETSHLEVRKNKIPIRRFDIDDLDDPVPKRSENLKIQGLLGWDTEVVVDIGQTLPLPMQVLGMAYKIRI